ncbi:CobW family GTP-binding protein [Roseinatronobacter monicus]|uniref:CobW family GTP-binding protein n=1 Tax=Roseinatronobacter monicus TaxID=393481 RepID=UPI003F348225
MHAPIPVTLLTGFLGSGKTTLLNRLLHDPQAGRVAVIVNEFGEAGLDHDLIEEAAEDVVLMPAGCICCSIRGDLSRTLISLLARRVRGELPFDRVVIETTGLADPGPVHHTLMVDPVLSPNYVLDGTVTVVDSALGARTLDRHAEAQAQVAMADRIVLSKRDLTDAQACRVLEARLDKLNPHAGRIWADKGAVPVGALWGLGVQQKHAAPAQVVAWLAAPKPEASALSGLSGLSTAKSAPNTPLATASHHASDDRITTASIEVTEPIAASVFDFWLDTLIALKGPDILRIKGIVHLQDMPHPFVFHGVQHIFAPPVPLENWREGDRTSRVVIIARDIPQQDLVDSLSMLRMRPEQDHAAQGITLHTMSEPF